MNGRTRNIITKSIYILIFVYLFRRDCPFQDFTENAVSHNQLSPWSIVVPAVPSVNHEKTGPDLKTQVADSGAVPAGPPGVRDYLCLWKYVPVHVPVCCGYTSSMFNGKVESGRYGANSSNSWQNFPSLPRPRGLSGSTGSNARKMVFANFV